MAETNRQNNVMATLQRWLLAAGIVSIVIALVELFLAVGALLVVLATMDTGALEAANQAGSLSVSVTAEDMEVVSRTMRNVTRYFMVVSLSLLVTGIYTTYVARKAGRMIRLSHLVTAAMAVSFVGILWTPWDLISIGYLVPLFVVLGMEALIQYLAWRIRREASGEAALELEREERRKFMTKEERLADPTRLGFLRVVQWVFTLHVLFSLVALIFAHRDNMTYGFDTLISWANLIFEGVCLYMLWNRMRLTRVWVIAFSIFNIVANALHAVFAGQLAGMNIPGMVGMLLGQSSADLIMIVYFLRSKRVQLVMTEELSMEVDDDAIERNRHGWPFIRNMALYYCVFSTLGHWMEAAFCQLVAMGLFAGDIDFGNTMLFRDWLYPFPMHGFAVVLIALILWPFKQWLSKRFNRWTTLAISFLANMLFCTAIEFGGGMLFNRNLQLWDYRDIPFNFMGQVCLQNAIGFGLAATFIVYLVYPLCERVIASYPKDVVNTVCVGVFTFYAILITLYLVDLSPEAAAANATQAASFVRLIPPLLR